MVKIFRFEEFTCNEEIFKKFIYLAKRKRGDLTQFIKNLVSFDLPELDPMKEEE
jgi:hypothetical protein